MRNSQNSVERLEHSHRSWYKLRHTLTLPSPLLVKRNEKILGTKTKCRPNWHHNLNLVLLAYIAVVYNPDFCDHGGNFLGSNAVIKKHSCDLWTRKKIASTLVEQNFFASLWRQGKNRSKHAKYDQTNKYYVRQLTVVSSIYLFIYLWTIHENFGKWRNKWNSLWPSYSSVEFAQQHLFNGHSLNNTHNISN